MENKLYVGNLPYSFRDQTLVEAFSAFGTVTSAQVIMEPGGRDRSKGFGFVEMADAAQAQAAVAGLHGKDVGGRALVVNVARPMEARPPRREGGGGYGQRREGGGGYGREGGGGGWGDRRDGGNRY